MATGPNPRLETPGRPADAQAKLAQAEPDRPEGGRGGDEGPGTGCHGGGQNYCDRNDSHQDEATPFDTLTERDQ
jgi:hypothetical protein